MQNLLLFLSLASFALATCTAQQQQFANIGDLRVQSGETIQNCRLGYRTFGKLNEARSNAVLFPTWFSGRTEDLLNFIGPGKLVDSSRFFVIAVDALGNGISSSPSNSREQPRMRFPKFAIRDLVESQYRLATKTFGLSHLHAVVGISMGGMQVFEWSAAYPDFISRAVSIVGTPQQTSYDLLLWTAEARAIENHPGWKSGEYEGSLPMNLVLDIHNLAMTTPQYIVAQNPPERFDKFLQDAHNRQGRAADANDWLRQLQAMLTHDVAREERGSLEQVAKKVRASVLIVVAVQDHMVNPAPSLRFARALKARTLELASDCGRLVTGCEAANIVREVDGFLKATAQSRTRR